MHTLLRRARAHPGVLINIIVLGFALAMSVLSLRWRIDFDTPLLLYIAHLIDRGYVPYRDIFDVNLPGTYLLNYLVIKLFGYGSLSYRIADLSFLGIISIVTFLWLRRLSGQVALLGAALFAVFYLRLGPLVSLQRDFLLLLPVSLSFLVLSRPTAYKFRNRALLGFLLGAATMIKPHALVALAITIAVDLLVSHHTESTRGRRLRRMYSGVLWMIAGFSIPLALAAFYLYRSEALASFKEITLGYWPLFGELSGEQRVLPTLAQRLEYRFVKSSEVLSSALLLLPASYGFFVALFRSELGTLQKRVAISTGTGAAAFFIYAFLAGRLWDYHLLPCMYFLTLMTALCLVSHKDERRSLVVLGLAVLQLVLPLGPRLLYGVVGDADAPQGGRVDEITDFLRANLRPGDRVQPIDWTGGAVNAMLAVRTDVATRFIYTYQFHHHVSTSYIQELRREFILSLEKGRPRFVIEIEGARWIMNGPDTSPNFAALRKLLDDSYEPVKQGKGFTIYELKGARRIEISTVGSRS